MPTKLWLRLLMLAYAVCALPLSSHAIDCKVAQGSDYFRPLTDRDGLRYPITIGPLSWRRLGGPLQTVKGSDGLYHLSYALLFINSWNRAASLKAIEVLDAGSDMQTGKSQVLTQKNEDITDLFRLFSRVSGGEKDSFASQLPPGQSAVMYFDVTYPALTQVPSAIEHRVRVSVANEGGQAQEFVAVSSPMQVSCKPVAVLSPPLRGAGWVDANGCCKEIGPHRFVMNSVNGSLEPTEDFAIDWVRLGPDGKMFHDDPKIPKNWYCYGAEIYAVGAGEVVEVVRDLQDVPAGANPPSLPLASIGGNRVIVALAQGGYANYEHLAPNSVTVQVGEHVREGQKLGLLGNTGNSDAPHLHVQLMSRPSSLDGWALPFVFNRMRLQGRSALSLQALDDDSQNGVPIVVSGEKDKDLQEAMPLSRDILDFAGWAVEKTK